MAGFRVGAGNIHDEPRIFCNARHSENARHTPTHPCEDQAYQRGIGAKRRASNSQMERSESQSKVALTYNTVYKKNIEESILI